MSKAAAGLDIDTRRTFLITELRNLGGRITTRQALEIYRGSPWAAIGRKAARRDLRDLARRTHLLPVNTDGPRAYVLGDTVNPPHPIHARGGSRRFLLEAIQREGGEWTVGRVKRAYRSIVGTHVWRATCRRHLAELRRLGHLDRHGEGTPRRYYTLRQEGATA